MKQPILPLSQLLRKIEPAGFSCVTSSDPAIAALTADSRAVVPGALFAALPGAKQDGAAFAAEAVAKGAAALLLHDDAPFNVPDNVAMIRAREPRLVLALLAAAFYGAQPVHVAAVTGTNGKTSTAQFLRELWSALGARAASIGTLGIVAPGQNIYGTLTTPDSVTLQQTLAALAADGVTYAALEASSHGLAQYRLDGVRIDAAGFTNLTRDHLDFHGGMENYLAAKTRLFAELLAPGGTAVLNADAPEAEGLAAAARGARLLRYGRQGKELRLVAVAPHAHGQELKLEILGKSYDVALGIVGSFQVWNALCALGLAIGQGADPDRAVAALAGLTGVRGRLEQAGTHLSGAPVFVDYAHTPDALETVLRALRPHVGKDGRLVAVFGCGGNRDRGKRPVMGGIAQRLADIAIVTDDNPRHEDPAAIRAEILAGCAAAPIMREIPDRAAAIRAAMGLLRDGDICVIAGKGHESGQIVGDKVLPFDDGEVARGILQESARL